MIRFACPSCGKKVKVSQDHAGKTGRCPACQGRFKIPTASAATVGVAVSPPAAAAPSKPFLTEADDMGTNQDSVARANSYWFARLSMVRKEPFVIYHFPTARAARDALLELPCIYPTRNSDRLICTETLTYGFYASEDGSYGAIVAGWSMTTELFEAARTSFQRHGGKPRGAGELSPETAAAESLPMPVADSYSPGSLSGSATDNGAASVELVRKYSEPNQLGGQNTYEIHRGPSARAAQAYLKGRPVYEPLYYIVVETPEGNWGRDKDGIYQE